MPRLTALRLYTQYETRRIFAFLVFSLLACQKSEISLEEHDGYTLAIQTKGPVLGYSSAPTIMVKDLMFKDLNRSGALDPYEDWRLPADMRTVEEQFEDTPHDMRCYTDADGNTYDFAFECL